MKKTILYLVFLVILLLFSGCANFNSIERRTSMPNVVKVNKKDVYEPFATVAIHLDAKQRLAISKAFGAFCAEPSPDALSAYAASLSGSYTSAGGKSVDLANQFGEGSRNIGLRTQSIQLMRDALYRVCEAYFSKALNSAQLMDLHQHYQDVLIGTLAIEQLTGAVYAATGSISVSGKASASSQQKKLQVELDQTESELGQAKEFQKFIIEKKEKIEKNITDKTVERDKAKKAYDELPLQTNLNEAKEKVKKLSSDIASTQNEVDKAQIEVEFLTSTQNTLNKDLSELKKRTEVDELTQTERDALTQKIENKEKEISANDIKLKSALDEYIIKQNNHDQKNKEYTNAESYVEATINTLEKKEEYIAFTKAEEELITLKNDLGNINKEIANTGKLIKEHENTISALENDINTLGKQQGAFAETSTHSSPSNSGHRTNIHDANTMRVAADNVRKIVEAIVKQPRSVETCLKTYSDLNDDGKEFCNMIVLGPKYSKTSMERNFNRCMKVLNDPSVSNATLKNSCQRIVKLYVENLEKKSEQDKKRI
ncbi:MAG: hypothetical protein AB2689_05975 [Candidatus Thiodiazotropha taylori]